MHSLLYESRKVAKKHQPPRAVRQPLETTHTETSTQWGRNSRVSLARKWAHIGMGSL